MKKANHYLYDKYSKQRVRVRDVLEGSDKIKDKGVVYLPKLTGQEPSEYDAYKLRATFFNITARVFGANVGMITRRSPTTKFEGDMSLYARDTHGFMSFYELFNSTIKEILSIGNCGVFVDIQGDRPVPVLFKAEGIKHWTLDADGTLKTLRLSETKFVDGVDETEYEYEMFVSESGVFSVETFEGGVSTGTKIPNYRGRVLDFIPFVGGSYKGLSMEPEKSPILDIVDLNLSHYRTSADYEHGLHFVALPTPVISGATLEGAIRLGCSEGIVLPDKGAKAYYLEFQGQGLDSLSKALEIKQAQISMFSARMQDTTTKGSEAENTVRLRYSADSASLYDIAFATELVLKEAYSIIAFWLGATAPEINLNKDFMSTKLSSAELKELAAAFVSGALDEATYIYNLERGELTIPGKTPVLSKPKTAEETQTRPKTDEGE